MLDAIARRQFHSGTARPGPRSRQSGVALQPSTLDRQRPKRASVERSPLRGTCRCASPVTRLRRWKVSLPGTVGPDYGDSCPGRPFAADGPLSTNGPGALTRWMAVPWQADSASCRSGYEPQIDPYLPTFWAARVPNHILTVEDYRTVMDTTQPRATRLAAFYTRLELAALYRRRRHDREPAADGRLLVQARSRHRAPGSYRYARTAAVDEGRDVERVHDTDLDEARIRRGGCAIRKALVIGAGPAGSVAALVLARAGIPVTLVAPPDRGICDRRGPPPAMRPVLGHSASKPDRSSRAPACDGQPFRMGQRAPCRNRFHHASVRSRLASRPPRLRSGIAGRGVRSRRNRRAGIGAQVDEPGVAVATDRTRAIEIVTDAVHRERPSARGGRRARDASASIVWSHARRCSLRRRPMPTPRRWSRPFVMDGGTPRVFLMRRAS